MKPGDALQYKIVNTSGVSDYVSTRVYQLRVPQDALLPYVVIEQIGDEFIPHTSGSDSIHANAPIFQIQCWAFDLDTAQDIHDAVETAIRDITNENIGDGSGLDVQRIFKNPLYNETYLPDEEIYGITCEYTMWHD
jgi:hypothetical protein